MSHIYCPECGFQSPEAASFCSRCGAPLVRDGVSETTQSLTVEEVAAQAAAVNAGVGGPALVVRAGGGREGETFLVRSGRTGIGRSPDCEVFLDDVTVSRRHADIVGEGVAFTIHDLGSLNGTFVNRKRIETAPLEDDDEVQIGKYRLTFLRR
jgi:pSer/pThr/pTyr-binding forkhead associated (FHA) protein